MGELFKWLSSNTVAATTLIVTFTEVAKDIRTYRKDVPAEVAERLKETLSRDVNKRPKSARTVLSGLDDFIKST